MDRDDQGVRGVEGVEKVGTHLYPEDEGSFLVLEKARFRTRYSDGTTSEAFPIDCVHRRGVDSVAVVLYDDRGPKLRVVLRRAVRPVLEMRRELRPPLGEEGPSGALVWEAVAGSLEPGDHGEEGLRDRLVQEVWEEAGLRIRPEQIEGLGAGFLPSHGQSTEMIHLRAAPVREEDQDPEAGRGTGPSEEGRSSFLDADEVLAMCRDGRVADPKVEIGLLRLLHRLGRLRILDA